MNTIPSPGECASKADVLCVCAVVLASACTALAQTPATPPAPAAASTSAGLLNDFLREQDPLFNPVDVGGQVRGRFEAKSGYGIQGMPGAVDFSRETPDNVYWLLREKVHLGWTPSSWVSVFGEARDSNEWKDKRTPEPEEDTFDLHQAYIALGNAKEFPITAKVGRQELSYGDERLIGPSDWNNLGRVFDAAKVRFENDTFWVDAFSGRVVIPRDDVFNTVNDYDWFSGVYASTKSLIPKQETQLYFLSRNVSSKSPTAFDANPPPLVTPATPRDTYTVGLRYKSLPGAYGGWDYDAEVAGQFGNYWTAKLNRRLDQEALAAHIAGGYTFVDTPWKPRVGLEYNFSSGDRNPNDGKHETFDTLFPTGHKVYGYMDFFSWDNMHNVRLSASAKPANHLTITADYHLFWLAETSDYFYTVSGAPRNSGGYDIHPGYNNFVGSELDLVATYQAMTFLTGQMGYGHFFRGQYVKQSLEVPGSQDADWFYAQAVFNF